jgi:hypothetical protein
VDVNWLKNKYADEKNKRERFRFSEAGIKNKIGVSFGSALREGAGYLK